MPSLEVVPITAIDNSEQWKVGPGDSVYCDESMVEELNRGSKVIQEHDYGSIVTGNGEHQRIATGNLTGCRAIAIMIESGTWREAYIQHFKGWKHAAEKNTLDQYLSMRQPIASFIVRAIILAPGQIHGFPSTTIPNVCTHPYDKDHVADLAAIIQQRAGKDANVQLVPYKVNTRVPRTLVVDLAESGQAQVTSSYAGTVSHIPISWQYLST